MVDSSGGYVPHGSHRLSPTISGDMISQQCLFCNSSSMHAGTKVDPIPARLKREPNMSIPIKREPGSQQLDAGVLKRIEDRVKTLRTDGTYLDLMDLFIFAEHNNKEKLSSIFVGFLFNMRKLKDAQGVFFRSCNS